MILAGGQGTRLWPLSRQATPKQFLELAPAGSASGRSSLLQEAVRRASRLCDGDINRVLVITQAQHAGLVRQQLPNLPEENLLLEPVGRNTAPALGLAAFALRQRNPQAVMLAFPVDHLFVDEVPWFEALAAAAAYARQSDALVTIGVPPASPSPRFGYLQLGEQVEPQSRAGAGFAPAIFRVQAFIEKPDQERACQFCASGEHLWNTGTFAWRVEVFLKALQQHAPEIYQALAAAPEFSEDLIANTGRIAPEAPAAGSLAEIYPALRNISVDYAVMEKAAGGEPTTGHSPSVAAVRGAFERIDVGALDALDQIWPCDEHANTLGQAPDNTSTLLVSKDSRQNIVYSDEGLVGLVGVNDLIVIRKGDILLVCPCQRANEVPNLLRQLQQENLERFL